MDYRCPHCRKTMSVSKLFFSDISSCKECHQKVTLGDFFAFFMAAISMMVTALSSLYLLTHGLNDPYVAGALSISIGMVTGLVVLLLLGRAQAYKPIRMRRAAPTA